MESLCRICLGEQATIPIFEEFVDIDGSTHSIQDKLAYCLNAKFDYVAGYPICICDCCHNTVNVIFNFINKYRETSTVLEERFKVLIKKETDNEDNECLNLEPCEDHDSFKQSPIEKQTKLDFEDEACLFENKKPCNKNPCQKPVQKKITTKGTSNKKLTNRKPKNKTPKIKINTRISALDIKDNSLLHKSKAVKKALLPVLCETCGEKFVNREKLKSHERIKHNLKVICATCDGMFSSKADLYRHIKRIHTDAKDFICNKCGKGFAFITDLNIHIKGVHEKTLRKKIPKKIKCEVCDKEYISKTLLLIHERSAHTGERPAVCTVCDKRFFHEEYLKQHMRLHTGERPYLCPVCGFGYAQLGNMKSHMRNHRKSELNQETLSKIKTSWHKFLKP